MTQYHDDIARDEVHKALELLKQAEKHLHNACSRARFPERDVQLIEYQFDDLRSDIEGIWLRYEDEHLRTAAE